MAKDYAMLLAEVRELEAFFAELSLAEQYNFYRQMRGEWPLGPSPRWREMVKVARRIMGECEREEAEARRQREVCESVRSGDV